MKMRKSFPGYLLILCSITLTAQSSFMFLILNLLIAGHLSNGNTENLC